MQKFWRSLCGTVPKPRLKFFASELIITHQNFTLYLLHLANQSAIILPKAAKMAEPSIYDEIELEDLTYHSETTLYTYPCPCGDQFEITLQDLRDGEDIAVCPSCSLMIRVIFEASDLPAEEPPMEEGNGMAVGVAA